MSNERSFDISVYTKEQVEEIFSTIEASAEGMSDHVKIERLITKSLGGRLMLTMLFEPNGAPLTLYRVTPESEKDWFKIDLKSTYSYPPNPSLGRANIEGFPVFYASLDPSTAIREMKNRLGPGSNFYISEWKLEPTKTIYGHCLILNSTTQSSQEQFLYKMAENHASQLEKLFGQIPKNMNEGMVHAARKMGDLFTVQGELKYNITSAYAHHIIYEARKQKAYMPILTYPAVENHQQSMNFAIHPELIDDETIKLKRVFKMSIPENSNWPLKELDQIQVTERGLYDSNEMEWQTLRVSWEIGNPENVFVKTDKDELIRGKTVLEYKFKKSKATIFQLIQRELDSPNLRMRLEHLAENLEIKDIMNYEGKAFEEIFILDLPEKDLMETNTGETISVVSIVMPVSWSKAYHKKL